MNPGGIQVGHDAEMATRRHFSVTGFLHPSDGRFVGFGIMQRPWRLAHRVVPLVFCVAASLLVICAPAMAVPADDFAPDVTIFSPTNGSTRSGTAVISYSVTDDNDPNPICNPAPDATVRMVPGPNQIVVTCRDAAGNESSASVLVINIGPNTTDTCHKVRMIGVRGSGENPGFGTTVADFGAKLQRLVDGKYDAAGHKWSYKQDPFDHTSYTAPGVGLWHPINTIRAFMQDGDGQYHRSVVDGGAALYFHLASEIASVNEGPCKGITKFVLAGYSQGAHAIATALANQLPRGYSKYIAAIVFFGDPKFTWDERGVYPRSTFDSRFDGILGGRTSEERFGYGGRVYSFCRSADLICQGNGSATPHESYPQAETEWGAMLAHNLTFGQPASRVRPVASLTRDGNQLHLSCDIGRAGLCVTRAKCVVRDPFLGTSTPSYPLILRSANGDPATADLDLSLFITNTQKARVGCRIDTRAISEGYGEGINSQSISLSSVSSSQ